MKVKTNITLDTHKLLIYRPFRRRQPYPPHPFPQNHKTTTDRLSRETSTRIQVANVESMLTNFIFLFVPGYAPEVLGEVRRLVPGNMERLVELSRKAESSW